MKKSADEKLPPSEITKREKGVLGHFLNSKPEPHKPIGKKKAKKKGPAK